MLNSSLYTIARGFQVKERVEFMLLDCARRLLEEDFWVFPEGFQQYPYT